MRKVAKEEFKCKVCALTFSFESDMKKHGHCDFLVPKKDKGLGSVLKFSLNVYLS